MSFQTFNKITTLSHQASWKILFNFAMEPGGNKMKCQKKGISGYGSLFMTSLTSPKWWMTSPNLTHEHRLPLHHRASRMRCSSIVIQTNYEPIYVVDIFPKGLFTIQFTSLRKLNIQLINHHFILKMVYKRLLHCNL